MPSSEQTLHKLVMQYFPNLGGRVSLSPIDTGKFNSSYWVEGGRRQLVLRVAPRDSAVFVFYERNMMRQEPEIHRLLRSRTTVPVAEILVFDDSHTAIDRDFMIMERLPGRPLTEMRHVDMGRVLHQMGQYLVQTHQLRRNEYGYLGAHRPMEPQSNWADAFALMWQLLIADVVSVGHYDALESRMMLRLLDTHLRLFDRPVFSSLLHMDIWHQNILVDEAGTVTGVVDWDRALWGDPEIEFAVLDYCGISEPPFWEGYGQARDVSPEAQVRRVFYLLYELQKYIVIRQGRHQDTNGARRYKAQVMGIVQQHFPGIGSW